MIDRSSASCPSVLTAELVTRTKKNESAPKNRLPSSASQSPAQVATTGPISDSPRTHPVSSASSLTAALARVSSRRTPPPGVNHQVGPRGSSALNNRTRPGGSTTSSRAVGRQIGAGSMAMTVPGMRDNRRMSPPHLTAKSAGRAPNSTGFRSGFACLVGRPNVGKSTLTNALVGAKVAITSDRPQTTRRVIRGIVHRPDAQLVIVDTPGLHRPRTLLGERLDSLVRSTLTEVDVAGFCVPAAEPVGPGDRYLARELAALKSTPVVAIVTKADQATPERVAEQLLAVSSLGDWADVVPVSAVAGYQLDVLVDVLVEHLPEGPPLYPEGELTDEPEQIMVAELIREAALDGVRDELPHSIAVVVEEMGPRPGQPDLTDVHADLYVERPSQKAIVIGTKGARLKEVGSRARHQIEALLGTRVYLDLHVKIAKDWQRNPKQLRRLGFYD